MPPLSNQNETEARYIRVTDVDEGSRDRHISLVVQGAVAEAMAEAVAKHMPTEEERQWVQLAMKREARREKLHTAIIEKSLTALVWAGIAGLGVVFLEWLKLHGWKSTP